MCMELSQPSIFSLLSALYNVLFLIVMIMHMFAIRSFSRRENNLYTSVA